MKQDFILNVLAIVICLFLLILQSKPKRKILKSVQVQNVFWLIGFSFYLLNIVNYYPLNEKVYVCSFLYLVTFNIVYISKPLMIKKKKGNNNFKTHSKKLYLDDDNKRINKCIIASIVCWTASIGILRKSIPVLIQYGSVAGFNALRYRTYGEYSIFSTIEMMLMNYLIRPIFVVTIILMAKEIATKKINYLLIIIGIMDSFWLIIATAGRALLVSLLSYIFFAIIALNGTNLLKLFKRYRRYIIPGVILLVVIIQIVSKRINRDNGVIEEGIIYYFSGLPYFSTMINQNIAVPFYLMGKGMFSFIIDLPFLILKYFGFSISGGSQYLSNIANSILPIGENLKTNATASTLLTFYTDFGIIGSALGGLLLGSIAKHVDYKLSKDFNTINFAKYLYVLSGLSITVQNYPFVGITTTMTWFFIYILLK